MAYNGLINNPDYKYYVVSARGIESGWEYKEDAQDFKREFDLMPTKIMSAKTLKSRGTPADDDGNWAREAARSDYSGLLSDFSIGHLLLGVIGVGAAWYVYSKIKSADAAQAALLQPSSTSTTTSPIPTNSGIINLTQPSSS